MNDGFVLPDRYEGLSKKVLPSDIPKIIIPVKDTLSVIEDLYAEIASSCRGAFVVLKGQSGCGKTTFLRTLPIFIQSLEVLTIDNSDTIEHSLTNLRLQTEKFRIIVIEGRESILDTGKEEIISSIHRINSFVRSEKGMSTLIVWPCNSDEVAKQLIETAEMVGGTALLGTQESYVEFNGPEKDDYVRIAKQTTEILNQGKALLDFGVSDEEASRILPDAKTIGEYLKRINKKVRENEAYVKNLPVKEKCRLWILVLALNEPSKDVEAITKGESLDADIQRMLVSTDANIVQDIKNYPEQIALASNYLDCKVIYISIIEALAIVRNYADAKLKEIMKERGLAVKEESDIKERLANTELVRMLNNDTKLKGRKGSVGSKSKEAFEKVLSISETNDTILNRTFGEALVQNGYVDEYEVEQDFGEGLTRRTDVSCIVKKESIRLEFMWRRKTSKAEISNYVLTKLFNYSKALGLIS